MNRDLTVGKPERVLWQYCMPLFGSIIFQQLYNLADSFVAGKFIGEEALAAVGNSYEITLIFIAFAFGCNIGCSVIVAQLFGAREYRDMKTAVSTTMILSAATCAVLMAIGLGLCTPLLNLIHTPENILEDSALYLRIYVLGLPFVFFYNVATGIFSALGDSKTPFWFLACSSLSNIFVDILFVTTFQMGVAGVAWATFLCQCVSCVLAVAVVFRRLAQVEGAEKAPVFSGRILQRILRIAIPSVLQQSFISVGNIILQGVINTFGSGVIAGYSAGVKLNNLVITSFTTLGNGISNYTAQNIGARLGAESSNGTFVCVRRQSAHPHIYRRADRDCDADGGLVSADFVAVLLCCLGKAGRRRHSARCGRDGKVHGLDVYGSDSARGAGGGAVENGARLGWHLVRMARRLDGCDVLVGAVL